MPAGSPVPPTLLRYFAPGVNWVGRSLYGVPVFGFALGRLGAALRPGRRVGGARPHAVGGGRRCPPRGCSWPSERRIQGALAGPGAAPVATLRPPARTIAAVAALLVVVLIAATVLMVAQP